MLSFAKNERGVRLASTAIILTPIAWLVISNSRSPMVDLIVGITWSVLAAVSLIAFLYEKAEEDDKSEE